MDFDFSRLRNGERIAAIGGVLLFILLFFDWYDVGVSVSGSGISGSRTLGSGTAWQVFSVIDIYLMLVAFTAIALAVLTATQRTPALPVTTAVITTAVAAIGTLLILFRIVDTPGPSGSESFFGATASVDVSPTFWAFVGLAAAAAITYGGYLSMREEGTTLQDVRAQAGAATQQARSAFEGGPPGTAEGSSAPPPPAAPPMAPPSPSDPPVTAPAPPGDVPPVS